MVLGAINLCSQGYRSVHPVSRGFESPLSHQSLTNWSGDSERAMAFFVDVVVDNVDLYFALGVGELLSFLLLLLI